MPRLPCLLLPILLAAGLASPARARPLVTVPQYSEDVVVRPDGASIDTVHIEETTADAAALRGLGRYVIPYGGATTQLEILEAYTRKQDGTKRAVDSASLITRDLQPDTKMITDLRMRVVIFPDLAPGDTIVLTYRATVQPTFPGQYLGRFALAADKSYADARITIRAPTSMALHARAENLVATRTEEGGDAVTTWRAQQTGRHGASLHVSSFADYDALAAAFAALVLPQARVTPPIQALADRLTTGITDQRAQIVALYDWVTLNVRYVEIELGIGGYQPHTADSVLANLYGDCKDHATLFAALLAAKGIASVPVPIGLGPPYALPDPPDLSWTNHMITYLPALDLYVDTTQEFDAFGAMPMQEYGKPVLHLTADGRGAVRQVPMFAPAANGSAFRTEATLLPGGGVAGSTVTSAHGPLGFDLRLKQRDIEKHGDKTVSARLLAGAGERGTGHVDHGDFALTPEYSVKAEFSLAPQPGWLTGARFAPPPGLFLLVVPGDALLGPLAAASPDATAPIACWPGRLREEIVLHLPPGKRPAALPEPVALHTDALEFHAAWSFSGDALTVRRDFLSRVKTPVCAGPMRAGINRALARIRAERQRTIALQDAPGALGPQDAPGASGPQDAPRASGPQDAPRASGPDQAGSAPERAGR